MATEPVTVLIASDWYCALYRGGVLAEEGKPEHLDIETAARLIPAAAIYQLPDDVYDELLDGAGYPPQLAALPLDRCTLVRAGATNG